MEQIDDRKDDLISENILRKNKIDTNSKTISKLLTLEIDYFIKIEKVRNQ